MRLIERLSHAWKVFRADSSGGINPLDDRYYGSQGYHTATGLKVSPESALRVAAVFACVRVVSETVASLPLIVYKRLPDGGKERATGHPLYKVLHDRPNQWQTAYEWLEMMQAHLELRGNAFSRIVPGPNGAVDQLIPLHPDLVQVYRLQSGKLKYQVRHTYNAEIDWYLQEEMLHLRGMSFDGMVGMSTVAIMAETIASGLAAQEYAGTFFENGAHPSGVFTTPKGLTDEQFLRYQRSIKDSQTGENAHKVMVLEEGMDFKAIGVTNKDAMLIEARQFSRGDIASGWRVPPHKIGDLSRATFSNIEQQNIEFATDCIRPRLVRFERRVQGDLVDPLEMQDGNEYYVEFLMDALLRGDIKSRYSSYAVARQWGWLSVNDVRGMENLNPLAEGGDEYLRPLNMVNAATADPDASDENVVQQDDTATGGARQMLPGLEAQKQLSDGREAKVIKARLKGFAVASAERVVRKEINAIRKLIERNENGTLAKEVADFYERHATFVAESMRISDEYAVAYIQSHNEFFRKLSAEEALSMIESCGAETLAGLALGEKQ